METRLDSLRIYVIAEAVADRVWTIVEKWDYFAKKTVGDQLVRAIDSIGANIAEGYGRYHYRDRVNFLYYARGSVYETRFWLKRAQKRNLIAAEHYKEFVQELDRLLPQINGYIKKQREEMRAQKAKSPNP